MMLFTYPILIYNQVKTNQITVLKEHCVLKLKDAEKHRQQTQAFVSCLELPAGDEFDF